MTRTLRTRRANSVMAWVGLVAGLVLTRAASGQEAWDAIYVGGSKVGHTHLTVTPVKDDKGRELVRVRIDWSLEFKRGNNKALMEQQYGTIETPDGEVLRLETRTKAASDVIRTRGDVAGDKMTLSLEAGGQRRQMEIPWGSDVRGPYGAELSLARKPLKPGESRDVKTYIPDLNKVCLTKLTAKDFEDVPLGPKNEKRKLLRIEQVVCELEGKPLPEMASTLWVDVSGQIMKSHTDLLGGMYTFRTTREGALGANNGNFNLLVEAIVRVQRPLNNSERLRDVVYRITLKDGDPTEVFPNDRRQAVRKGDKGTATMEVRTAGMAVGDPGAGSVAPEYLNANPLINSDDAGVIAHMRQAVGNQADPWARAVAIEDYVFKKMTHKDFSTAFAPASEVARSMSGDCSEHSVLTAAMCRAAGIPARCVVGLVYAENVGGRQGVNGFGPHMWNEVYVNRRWVAIDSAFNQSDVDATHLKLTDSSLDGVAPFEAFLPVLRTFNKGMKIEPVEAR